MRCLQNILRFPAVQIINRQQQRNYRSIGIIGAPFDKGQPREGTALAPALIRSRGLCEKLKTAGCNVRDYGDVDCTSSGRENVSRLQHVFEYCEKLSNKVASVISDGRLCLTLGGDHSIGLGTVHGSLKARPDTSLIWVDAHADINTPVTSPSGNVHGMPLSFNILELAGYHPELPASQWHSPVLSAKNLALIGLRDVDPMERLIIDQLGICALSMEEVHDMGIKECIRYTLGKIDPENKRPIHVSFDIDALDPLEAPATGTPVRGGLTLREGLEVLRSVSRTERLSAVDIVEVNPLLGNEAEVKLTADAAVFLAQAAANIYVGGTVPKHTCKIPRP